ncbi:MAG: ABC transporter ATP-binding protein [Halobacteriaceae archaeon]
MTTVDLSGVTKIYDDARGQETAIEGLDLTIREGEFAILVGPSGCGKSTTLRLIAGLERVTKGEICFGGEPVHELAPSERDVAMVFQNYALYPNMTGRENMAYGLKHSEDLQKHKRAERVDETAELLDITDVIDKKPKELSGGQKQRVALGRAITRDPDVFLMDEPLSNLDAKLRAEMRREIQRIQEKLDITTIYVTHDQKEAMTMADRLAVLRDGRLQQVDEPETAYHSPNNQFVGEFLGSPSMNIYDASVEGERIYIDDSWIPSPSLDLPDQILVGLRPEDIEFGNQGDGTLEGDVIDAEYQGDKNFIFLSVKDREMTVRAPRSVKPNRGERKSINIDPDDLYCFHPSTGKSIVK